MRVSYKLLIIIIVILLVITGETAKLDDDDSEMIEALVLASLLSKNRKCIYELRKASH
jgi:hypothetical protein